MNVQASDSAKETWSVLPVRLQYRTPFRIRICVVGQIAGSHDGISDPSSSWYLSGLSIAGEHDDASSSRPLLPTDLSFEGGDDLFLLGQLLATTTTRSWSSASPWARMRCLRRLLSTGQYPDVRLARCKTAGGLTIAAGEKLKK